MNKKILDKIKYYYGEFYYYYIYKRIIDPIDTFIYRVNNIIKWIPVIWNDYECTQGPLLRILEFKLRNMRDYFLNSDMEKFSTKEIRRMSIAINAIKRIRESHYGEYYWKMLDIEWGALDLSTMQFCREKLKTEEDRKRYIKDSKKIYEYEDYMAKQDLEILGKMFKHIQKWWD